MNEDAGVAGTEADDRVACSFPTGNAVEVPLPSKSSPSAKTEQRPQNTDPRNDEATPKKRSWPSDHDERFIA
jgi:hypothetical protein